MERLLYRFRRRISAALIAAAALALAAAAAPPAVEASAAYSDTGRHWAAAEIARWESLGVLRDFGSGSFRPDAAITRAEFFAILVRTFEAEEKADISGFTDVPADAWYYDIVAMANKMRIAEGTSATTMHPEANISRQDAATLVARAFGLSDGNSGYLGRYVDSGEISVYAQNYVSAMTRYGYMVGSGERFYPRANLSRAEAVKIVDNLFRHFYESETGFDQIVLNGNVASVRPDSVFSGLTINGDLILGDGVGAGNAALNSCVINGRLLIRGGGENSVVLSDTSVRDGITVINPNRNTRIVTTGSTSVDELTAFSGFTLVGTGVHSVRLADDAIPNSFVTLSGVVLDSMDAGGLTAKITMPEGKISKLSFVGDSAGSQFSLGKDASVSYLSTVAPNITLLGDGHVSDAFINAPGAVFVIKPDTYTVGANLTASIAGNVVSGEYLNTGNWVSRDENNLPVRQDANGAGGADVVLTTSAGRSANTVTATLRPAGKIPLSSAGGRPGYDIGIFIPAPSGLSYSQRTTPLLTYQQTDGGVVVMRNQPLAYQNGVYGLSLRIPVTRDSSLSRGRLAETMYINWDGQLSENLIFRSGWLDLEPMTWYDEAALVSMYRYARLNGYNGVVYTGPEAIMRLLNGDNALGLDTNGFGAFSAEDQEDLAASLYEVADVFTTKQAIQDKLDQILSGKGALYAVNRALTADQMRKALEHPVFARELGIEVSAGSSYGALSETGKGRVASTLLTNRKKDYASNAAVKSAFDKAVSDIKTLETGLLVAINSASAASDVQKIIETKANAELLSFAPGSDPYKGFTAPQKLALAQRIFNARPFSSVDDIAQIIRDYLASPDIANPEDDAVSALKLTPTSISLVVGQSANLGYGASADVDVQLAITTPSGTIPNPVSHVTAAVDKEDIAVYGAGVITAKAAGTAKITLTSVSDAKKKITLTVKVNAPVPATGLKMSKTFAEVEVGGRLGLGPLVTVIPATSTDKLTWTSETPAVASVNAETGEVKGVESGFARVVVRATSGVTASVLVAVVSLTDGIMIYPEKGTVGVSETVQLYAVVSPLDRANRTVKWSSEDAAIAKVDGSGVVEGVSTGENNPVSVTVDITAAAARDPSMTAASAITVDRSKKTLLLDKTEMTLYPGGMEQILATVMPAGSYGDVVWSVATGGNNTVSVDAEGRVVGLNPGKTSVVATIDVKEPEDREAVAVCEVTVLEGKPTITVSPKTLDLIAGDKDNGSKLVTVSFTPANMANKTVHWSVPAGDEEIVKVETDPNTGRVRITGLSPGSTVVQGIPEADKDCRLEIAVTVKGIAITQFKITPKQITITDGNTELLSKLFDIVMKPDNVTNKEIEWTSGDPNAIEIRKSETGEETDVYGGSRLVALKTTMTSHQEIINDAEGEPLLDETGSAQFKTIWEDKPVALVAQASNGTTIDLLVSVAPKDADQVNNIKIDMDQWIYPVGQTQLMTVRYNIKERNLDGSWVLGKQPPNVKLSWDSDKPEVAYVNEKDQLVTVSPGVAKITVTAQDSGKTDSITIIVASYGPESIGFNGLDSRSGYGRFIQMYVGDT
ncbi:MAG: Ig-like domain-containing protein, partial [Oscillospiraceae bacterium]|nr:Ig-like domain-containing protein [Oscillospiraceae bacterium]